MDYASLSKIIEHPCHPVTDDDGSIARIDIPFRFADGDEILAFVELGPEFVRFFDAGDLFDHFAGLGVPMNHDEDIQFLKSIADSHGLSVTELGEVEIVTAPERAVAAFAQYMAVVRACMEWERARDEALEIPYRQFRGRVA
jgi:hypothetical protein